MKRGFFNSSAPGKGVSRTMVTHEPLPPSIRLASEALSTQHTSITKPASSSCNEPLIKAKNDQTIVEEISPLILHADSRIDGAPYFGYFPPSSKEPEMVIISQDLQKIEKAASWKIWSESVPKTTPADERAFIIKGQAGKGMAMFAARDIAAGEEIHRERPISVTVQKYNVAPDQGPTTGDFYRSALSRLGVLQQRSILSLSNCWDASIDLIPGIMQTNSLPVDLQTLPDASCFYCGVFPTLSRANHSCAPNANYFFQFKDFTGRFYASRNIEAGEEITIMYCDLLQTQEGRRDSLYRSHRFLCQCDFCSASPTSIQARNSNSNRLFIKSTITGLAPSNGSSVSVSDIHKAILIAEQEALPAYRAHLLYYGGASLLHRDKAHAGVALKWLEQAKILYEQLEGKDSYNVAELSDIVTK